jgi:hypothetical protein
MSISGDKTGIAGVWITGKRPPSVNDPDTSGKELEFKLAFSVSVKAPKGAQVSFEKNRNFIRWLRDCGFAIKGVSSDTFQSANLLQNLKSDSFKTQILSVDRVDTDKVCKPYAFFKTAIYERHIKIYKKCDLLTDEIIGLERLSNGKIDHSPSGINSKDQSDAVCGALFLASQFADEYSYSYGENLDVSLDVNTLDSDVSKKQMMIESFQQELTQIYLDQYKVEEALDYQKKQEYMTYQDILNGIIIL